MSLTRYFLEIKESVLSVGSGLGLALRHLFDSAMRRAKVFDIRKPNYFLEQQGIVTVRFPHEHIPVPDNGRYQLHCEISDCIVCDQCARICPVDCIAIEGIRSPTEIAKASNGSPIKIHLAKFEIDMGKCCFCGLCTVVCPTECLIMTPEYDYSMSDPQGFKFEFAIMTAEAVQEKKKNWEIFQMEKKKAAPKPPNTSSETP